MKDEIYLLLKLLQEPKSSMNIKLLRPVLSKRNTLYTHKKK